MGDSPRVSKKYYRGVNHVLRLFYLFENYENNKYCRSIGV